MWKRDLISTEPHHAITHDQLWFCGRTTTWEWTQLDSNLPSPRLPLGPTQVWSDCVITASALVTSVRLGEYSHSELGKEAFAVLRRMPISMRSACEAYTCRKFGPNVAVSSDWLHVLQRVPYHKVLLPSFYEHRVPSYFFLFFGTRIEGSLPIKPRTWLQEPAGSEALQGRTYRSCLHEFAFFVHHNSLGKITSYSRPGHIERSAFYSAVELKKSSSDRIFQHLP